MPDGLAIKTFAFSPLPPNSLLTVYGFEFEYTIQKLFQIFSKKIKQITSTATNFSTALTVLWLPHTFPNIM